MSSVMPNGTPAASDPAAQQANSGAHTSETVVDTSTLTNGQPAASQSDTDALNVNATGSNNAPATDIQNPAAQKASQEAAKYRAELRAAQQRLAEYEAAQRAAEEAQLTELEKANRRLAEYQTQEAQWQMERQQWRLQQAVQTHAARLGIIDLDAAAKLLDTSELEYDEQSGAPTNVEALLTAMLDRRPWLRGTQQQTQATPAAPNVGATNPARPSGPLTITPSQYSDPAFRTQYMRDFGEDILAAVTKGKVKIV